MCNYFQYCNFTIELTSTIMPNNILKQSVGFTITCFILLSLGITLYQCDLFNDNLMTCPDVSDKIIGEWYEINNVSGRNFPSHITFQSNGVFLGFTNPHTFKFSDDCENIMVFDASDNLRITYSYELKECGLQLENWGKKHHYCKDSTNRCNPTCFDEDYKPDMCSDQWIEQTNQEIKEMVEKSNIHQENIEKYMSEANHLGYQAAISLAIALKDGTEAIKQSKELILKGKACINSVGIGCISFLYEANDFFGSVQEVSIEIINARNLLKLHLTALENEMNARSQVKLLKRQTNIKIDDVQSCYYNPDLARLKEILEKDIASEEEAIQQIKEEIEKVKENIEKLNQMEQELNGQKETLQETIYNAEKLCNSEVFECN